VILVDPHPDQIETIGTRVCQRRRNRRPRVAGVDAGDGLRVVAQQAGGFDEVAQLLGAASLFRERFRTAHRLADRFLRNHIPVDRGLIRADHQGAFDCFSSKRKRPPLRSGQSPEAGVLTGLRLENIALIERLELAFSRDSPFSPVRPVRASRSCSMLLMPCWVVPRAVRGPAAAAPGLRPGRIEASFSLTPPLLAWLETQGLEPEDRTCCSSAATGGCRRSVEQPHRIDGVA
jgi:hypothetical protein